MKLSEYLSRECVAVLDAESKNEALEKAIDLLRTSPAISDPVVFSDAIWQREEALSTGIGLGIGVPHVRCKSVRSPAAALVTLRQGVDYGSIDGIPVRVILMIAMPEGMHKEYLQYLATACRLFPKAEFREKILVCPDAAELWAVVQDY
jgi:nitrogen PTS system EIIA component